jgi:hypothetical protein
MSIPQKDLRVLFQRSGNICAFPDCGELLTSPDEGEDPNVVLSEVAHIVAKSPQGPRGDYEFPLEQRDQYDNLILLCKKHHTIVDNQPQTYPVAKLRQMKRDHEARIQQSASAAVKPLTSPDPSNDTFREDILYSSLLEAATTPKYMYGVETEFKDGDEKKISDRIRWPNDGQMCVFVIRGGKLWTFHNLRYKGGPFRDIVGNRTPVRKGPKHRAQDEDLRRWYVTLLNRSLNKLTGRKGLMLDKKHSRYYFVADIPGSPHEVPYQPMNQSRTTRQVVWQPITKKTGKPKTFWYHRAVSLRFHEVAPDSWCLSIRPEFHISQDGQSPPRPRGGR